MYLFRNIFQGLILTCHSLSESSLVENTGYTTCEQNLTRLGFSAVQKRFNRGARELDVGSCGSERGEGYSAA